MAIAAGGISLASMPQTGFSKNNFTSDGKDVARNNALDDKYRIIPKETGLPITGTFLDEITWDIPSQNWGYEMWDKDFAAMKKMGIDSVFMIRGAFG